MNDENQNQLRPSCNVHIIHEYTQHFHLIQANWQKLWGGSDLVSIMHPIYEKNHTDNRNEK